MSKSILQFIPLLMILTYSCEFNKLFYSPIKIPKKAKGETIVNPKTNDSTIIKFSSENHQPLFLKTYKDTIDLGFQIESVVFKSESGNKLNGWILKNNNNIIYPITIFHLHGNGGNLFSQYQLISKLVGKEFQVFMFDYSGYGFSDGNPTRKNLKDDALSALKYLKNRKDLNKTKIVIYGQSLGGNLASKIANEFDVDGLVLEGAFSSHKNIAAEKIKIPFVRLLIKEGYSTTKELKKYHKPVLIIHSTDDQTVPFAMGKNNFRNANQPKYFLEIKKPHLYGTIYYTDSIANKIKKMISTSTEGQN